ncbi:MAG TPA: thermonuclease family protein [Methanoregulaceae archaeon]|nr:thermonuclease family protein [Methanoregulaceae archaeon]
MKGSNTIIILILCLFLTGSLAFSGCSRIEFAVNEGTPGDTFEPGRAYGSTVTRVVDGDTVVVEFPGGTEEKIRIVGVDTPETTPSENIPGEYPGIDDPAYLALWGENAKEFTSLYLEDREIAIEFDEKAGIRDQYDRLLAYVILPDGTDFGALLVSEGLARVYTGETFSKKSSYLALETAARIENTGLWNYSSPILPPAAPVPIDTPGQGVFIAAVNYDAAGDDRENLNDEYLIIANAGPGAEKLSGWSVSGPTQVTFTFGPLQLMAGGQLTLHTGTGISTGSDVYRNLTTPALNNRGGILHLLDQEGQVVSLFQWGASASP